MSIGIVTNLNARKTRKDKERGERLTRILDGHGIVRQTRNLDELRDALEEFVDRGCRCWVADGGDGTLHWMMNVGREVLEAKGLWNDEHPFPILVPTNSGTIDFVARKAGIHGPLEHVLGDLVQASRENRELPLIQLDTMEIRGVRAGEEEDSIPFKRLGFAIAIGGIGQRFFSKYYESNDPNRWTILSISLKAAAGQLASIGPLRSLPIVPRTIRDFGQFMLSGTPAEVHADGKSFPRQRFQGLAASAVDIDFGTMRLFPHARKPGKLHMMVGSLQPIEYTYKWILPVLGKTVSGENWYEFAGETMDVDVAEGELLDPNIDGEMFYGLKQVSLRPGPRISVPALGA